MISKTKLFFVVSLCMAVGVVQAVVLQPKGKVTKKFKHNEMCYVDEDGILCYRDPSGYYTCRHENGDVILYGDEGLGDARQSYDNFRKKCSGNCN